MCVLAVTLAHLLAREYARQDLKFSIDVLLRELMTSKEVLSVFPDKNGGTYCIVTERSPHQQQLLDVLGNPVPRFESVR